VTPRKEWLEDLTWCDSNLRIYPKKIINSSTLNTN